MIITYPLNNANNYIFDSERIEIQADTAKLKQRINSDICFYVSFNNDLNADIARGAGVGIGVGNAAVIEGVTGFGKRLDLAHSDNRYVDYAGGLNTAGIQEGAISFRWTPNYDNIPAAAQIIFCISDGTALVKNRISITHLSTGGIYLVINNKNGGSIFSAQIGTLSVAAGQTYTIELNYNLTVGRTRVFIDGQQFGNLITNTGERDNNINQLRIGNYQNPTYPANFFIDEFIIYDKEQHLANYAPADCEYLKNYYSADNPLIITSNFRTDGIISVSADWTAPLGTGIKFIINVNNSDKYWDGAAWSASDGSYNKSNTIEEINAHCDSLINGASDVYLKIILNSDGYDTPEIFSAEIEYDFAVIEPQTPERCIVYGWLKDGASEPIINESVEIKLGDIFKETNFLVVNKNIKIISDAEGYFEIALIPSSYINNAKYTIYIGGDKSANIKKRKKYIIDVPVKSDENFVNLIF